MLEPFKDLKITPEVSWRKRILIWAMSSSRELASPLSLLSQVEASLVALEAFANLYHPLS